MYLILEDETGVISKAEASEFCLRKLIQMLRKKYPHWILKNTG